MFANVLNKIPGFGHSEPSVAGQRSGLQLTLLVVYSLSCVSIFSLNKTYRASNMCQQSYEVVWSGAASGSLQARQTNKTVRR